jgi:thiol-disulfide isomerase/thioredoxin
MTNRRRALATIATIATLPLGGVALPLRAAPAAPGDRVAWPEVTLLDGGRWTAARAQGKAVVVVFWSTTCPFCLRHNQHVSRLQKESAGLPLEIITVARERDAQEVRRYLERHGHRFAVTLEHAPMAAALSTRRTIPLTVTVDRAGRLRQVIPGEMFEDDVLELAQLARRQGD